MTRPRGPTVTFMSFVGGWSVHINSTHLRQQPQNSSIALLYAVKGTAKGMVIKDERIVRMCRLK